MINQDSPRRREYRDHLQSEQWQEIRTIAADRKDGLCELCGSAGAETHHIKYPKTFAQDAAGHVLCVCSACHRRLHGMNQLITDRNLAEIQVETFKGRPVHVWVDERRWVWAPWDSGWLKALVIPRSLEQRVTHLTVHYAQKMSTEWGEPYCLHDPKGVPWYRWHPINKALGSWQFSVANHGNSYSELRLNDDEKFLLQNISKIEKWGNDLQERAMSGAIESRALARVDQSAKLSQAMSLLAEVTQEHDTRISVVEKKILRDENEFVDASSFLIQEGIDPNLVAPSSGLIASQFIGSWCAQNKCERGPSKEWSLPWGKRGTKVNTWRRSDLRRALGEMHSRGAY